MTKTSLGTNEATSIRKRNIWGRVQLRRETYEMHRVTKKKMDWYENEEEQMGWVRWRRGMDDEGEWDVMLTARRKWWCAELRKRERGKKKWLIWKWGRINLKDVITKRNEWWNMGEMDERLKARRSYDDSIKKLLRYIEVEYIKGTVGD